MFKITQRLLLPLIALVIFMASPASAQAAQTWLPGYDRAAAYAGHVAWHLAVFELALGRFRAAMATYARGVSPEAVQQRTTLFDAAGFLWRCALYGHAPHPTLPWRPVLDRLPGQFTLRYDHARWAVYEVTGNAG